MGNLLQSIAAALAPRRPSSLPTGRQPLHVFYGGAHLFRADTARKMGKIALSALDGTAPDPETFASMLGIVDAPAGLAEKLHARVRDKLSREPIEDFRIDFEDGYGARSASEEDSDAAEAAKQLAAAFGSGCSPPFVGLRVKPLDRDNAPRAFRTLEIFARSLSGAPLPAKVTVTLPKVRSMAEIAALGDGLQAIETETGLPHGFFEIEMMVETVEMVRALFDASTRAGVADLAGRRLKAAHFGGYDYSSALGIPSFAQSLAHPACGFARQAMQIALCDTLWLSDGATHVLPVGPHRGRELTNEQRSENLSAVGDAWKAAFLDIARSLSEGFYQGWDIHPAQLPVRYAANFYYFLRELPRAAHRLRAHLESASRTSSSGSMFDDAASAGGLFQLVRRGLACGAYSDEDLHEHGLSRDELEIKS